MAYNISEIMADAHAVAEENRRLRAEARVLEGRLKEARRENRAMGRQVARGRAREENWRQALVAAAGMAMALTSLLYAALIVMGGAWG